MSGVRYSSGGTVYHVVRSGADRAICGRKVDAEFLSLAIPKGYTKCKKCIQAAHMGIGKSKAPNKPKPVVITQPNKEKPVAEKSNINPKHYDLIVNGQPTQVVDLIEARFADDAHMAQAMKYFLRAGHKGTSSYTEDVAKGVWWAVRALMFNKVKSIELPPGAPVK